MYASLCQQLQACFVLYERGNVSLSNLCSCAKWHDSLRIVKFFHFVFLIGLINNHFAWTFVDLLVLDRDSNRFFLFSISFQINEEASEKVLEVEQKYNEIRKPVYDKRNDIIKSIPDFWLTAVSGLSYVFKLGKYDYKLANLHLLNICSFS